MKLAKIALISFSLALLVFRCYRLFSIKFDVDNLTDELKPAMAKIPLAAKMGFKDYYGSYETVSLAQFILAPRVIVDDKLPDILLIEQKVSSVQKLPGKYRILNQSISGDKLITVLSRVK